jgi:K+/H+ antiporter YhaU regulatory subunit KhtT
MQLLTTKEYATKNKISIFNVMKMVKSQQLKTITKEENGKEIVYILPDDSNTPQSQSITTAQDDKEEHSSMQDEIIQLKDEVAKLRSELNRLKVTVFKMAKGDAKILKI